MQSHFNCQSVIISLQETPLGLSVHQDTGDAGWSIVCWLNRKAEGPPRQPGLGEAADVDCGPPVCISRYHAVSAP